MRLLKLAVVLYVMGTSGVCVAQTVWNTTQKISDRIHIPTAAEFRTLTGEEQRAFQSAGLAPTAGTLGVPPAGGSVTVDRIVEKPASEVKTPARSAKPATVFVPKTVSAEKAATTGKGTTRKPLPQPIKPASKK